MAFFSLYKLISHTVGNSRRKWYRSNYIDLMNIYMFHLSLYNESGNDHVILVEANSLKWMMGKNKKLIIVLIIVIIAIAGLLDIIFEGLLYQLLSNLF